jgi:hypothetical protein
VTSRKVTLSALFLPAGNQYGLAEELLQRGSARVLLQQLSRVIGGTLPPYGFVSLEILDSVDQTRNVLNQL